MKFCVISSVGVPVRTGLFPRAALVLLAALCFPLAETVLSAGNESTDPPKTIPPTPQPERTGGDPVSLITGSVKFDQTDVSVPCPGVPLEFVRYYISGRGVETNAACGPGWRNSWEWGLQTVVYAYSLVTDSPDQLFADLGGAFSVGQTVSVGSISVTFKSFEQGSTQVTVVNGQQQETKNKDLYVFEARRTTEVKLMTLPDGRSFSFSGSKNLGNLYILADDGNYRLGAMFVEPVNVSAIVGDLAQMEQTSSWREYTDASGVVWDGIGTTYMFGGGTLESVRAPGGETVTVARDGSGRITRLSHSNGQALSLQYDGMRAVRLDTPSPGLYMTYAYDASGCLTGAVRHTSSGAFGDSYQYMEGGHCLTNRVNAAGRAYRYAYSPVSRYGSESQLCTFSELSGGYYRTEYAYGANDNSSVLTEWLSDGSARRTRTEWDSAWQIRQSAVIPPVAGVPAPVSDFTCTTSGDFSTERHTSASGDCLAVSRLFDGRYNVTNESFAVNGEPQPSEGVSYGWDGFYSLPLWRADADGVVAESEFDDSCRPVNVTRYPSPDLPAVTGFGWSNSVPVSVTDACGRVTLFAHDAFGYLSGVVPQTGPAAGFENDALGNVRRIVTPSPDPSTNRVTLIAGDEIGRNRTVTYPDGLSESVWHDACGNPTSSVSRAGRRTDITWLPAAHAGSVTRWLDAATPATVAYNYDFLFRTLAVVDPMGREVERYSLDDEDRVTAVTNLEGQVFSAAYGAGGEVLSMARYDGVSVSNAWDRLGHLLGTLHKAPGAPDWAPVSGYAWSTAGRLLAASNAVSRSDFAYDGAGRVTNETQRAAGGQSPAVSVAWSYDASGLLTNTVLSATGYEGALCYSAGYDAGSRIASQGTFAGPFAYSYCGWNGRVSAVSNAALTVENAYDMLDRVTNTVYRNGAGAAVRSFAYAYDPDGLLTQKVTVAEGGAVVTDAYAYDGLGRLVSAGGESFSYDLAGNRLSSGSRSWTYTHNRDDGVFYDAAGNATGMVGRSGVTNTLLWNTRGQLVSVSTNGAFAESYVYDALGRRVATTDSGGTVYHVYDGNQCVADADSNGNPLRIYAWGPGIDNLLSVAVIGYDTTNVYYAVKDRLGSVCALVDAQGQVAESYTYDAWGNVLSGTSAINNRYLWHGREYSAATGLYNFRARWYDPETGRWLSKDPIGLEGGLNLYAFCGDNPVNGRDPDGLKYIYDGVVGPDAERQIQSWKENLNRDTKLYKIINELEISKNEYTITDLKKGYTEEAGCPEKWRPYTDSYWRTHWSWRIYPMFTCPPPCTIFIDNKNYNFDGRAWTFPEALAHELLHGHNKEKNRPATEDLHWSDTWKRNEAQLMEDVRSAK